MANQLAIKNPITYIPENDYGLDEGAYTTDDLAAVLRAHMHRPLVIQFIADMLEETP